MENENEKIIMYGVDPTGTRGWRAPSESAVARARVGPRDDSWSTRPWGAVAFYAHAAAMSSKRHLP